MRLGEQVMCGSAYLYVFGIHLYVQNTFLAFSVLSVFSIQHKKGENYIAEFRSESQWILVNMDVWISSHNYSSIYGSTLKNVDEYLAILGDLDVFIINF